MPKFPITDIVSIYEQQRSGNTESYQTSPTYQNVNACISPTGTDIQTDIGDVPSFQLFEIFLYDITLQIGSGSKIVTANTKEYLVAGKPFVVDNQYLKYIRILGQQVV